MAFWVGEFDPDGEPDAVDRLEEFNYWLAVSWELQANVPSSASRTFENEEPLTRWLGADSLQTLCTRVYPDFRDSCRISRLLIVSRAEGQRASWALCPHDDGLIELVDRWFASAASRVSDLPFGDNPPCPAQTAQIIQPDIRLRQAGLEYGTLIDTGHNTSYCVFWGVDRSAAPSALSGSATDDHDPVRSSPLWRRFEAALANMAHLEHLRELSHIDSMTNIFNRRHFNMRLIEEVARARRFQRPLALTVLDIDHFKVLNDTHGHQAGDTILRRTAEFVHRIVRSIDVFCRLGGDEFAVLMPDAGPGDCIRFGERLCSIMAAHRIVFDPGVPETTIAVSMGGAVFPAHADQHERLLWCADMALLRAKQQGRNQFVLYRDAAHAVRGDEHGLGGNTPSPAR